MTSSIAIVLTTLVGLLVQSSDGARVPQSEKFQYLGSIQKTFGYSSFTNTSHYFASYNALGYANAIEECRDLDAASGLVKIETPEELWEIKEFLGQHGNTGTKYWTAGIYDEDQGTDGGWTWDIKDGPELSYDAWDRGFPPARPTLTSRIVLSVRSRPKLQVYDLTDSFRYICESTVAGQLPSTTTAGDC